MTWRVESTLAGASRCWCTTARPAALRAVLALGLGALCACGSDLVWYGHTADRARRIEIRERGGTFWLDDAGRESRRYDAIPPRALVRSAAGGRVAFAAMSRDPDGRERWRVIVDLVPGPVWDGVAGLRFDPSGRHVAYAAERGGRWRVVVDAAEGPQFDSLDVSSLGFSPDGSRYGYVALDGHCARVVVGRQVGACRSAVQGLTIGDVAADDVVIDTDLLGGTRVSVGGVQQLRLQQPVVGLFADPSHKHWAVQLEAEGPGGRVRIVHDGHALPERDEIRDVVFAPDGHTLAYCARDQQHWFVVVAGVSGPSYRAVEAPVFSDDGRHWGYIGRTQTASDIVVDGRVRFRTKTPTARALVLGPDGRQLAFVYRDARSPIVVVNRRAYRFDVVIEGTLRFDHSGAHWAMLVGELDKRELYIVVDGQRRLRFDSQELFGGGLGRGDAIARLGRWVSAEMERAARVGPRLRK